MSKVLELEVNFEKLEVVAPGADAWSDAPETQVIETQYYFNDIGTINAKDIKEKTMIANYNGYVVVTSSKISLSLDKVWFFFSKEHNCFCVKVTSENKQGISEASQKDYYFESFKEGFNEFKSRIK